MTKQYRASAEATSRHPQDWGRAMSWAMTDLATQALADGNHERLFGEDLQLRVTPTEEGVDIALAWDAPEDVERSETGAIIIQPSERSQTGDEPGDETSGGSGATPGESDSNTPSA